MHIELLYDRVSIVWVDLLEAQVQIAVIKVILTHLNSRVKHKWILLLCLLSTFNRAGLCF